ncbi:MAG: hypothetical protein V2J24_21000 [Pseudomonadales bacterium]|jgi:hypothetical protein|nr:hypothetical protein [Pseudomonadales bacterium]
MKQRLPKPEEISRCLEMLFGSAPEVSEAPAVEAAWTATYVTDEDEPVAWCSFDLPAAAYLGSALSMIPKPGADDAVKEASLSKMMVSNLYEVANIFSSFFMGKGTPHLRLVEVEEKVDGPEPLARFSIDIPGYGKGSVSFAAL